MRIHKMLSMALAVTVSVTVFFSGCGNENAIPEATNPDNSEKVSVLNDIQTVQAFTEESVDESDLKTILMAGVNAPSAMNKQPWHFTAVTNKDILKQISDDMSAGRPPMAGGDKKEMPAPPKGDSMTAKAGIADAPVAIIISCKEGSELDAGLACELMSDMANVMGYGTKIISSPTIALNGDKKEEYKKLLEIPEDQSAAVILLIGHAKDSPDSASGATERDVYEDVVSAID